MGDVSRKAARWAVTLAVGTWVWGAAPAEAPAKFGLGFGGGSRVGRGMGARHSGQVGRAAAPQKMSWETSASPGSPVARERFRKRDTMTVRQRIVIHQTLTHQDDSRAHQVVTFEEQTGGAPTGEKVDLRAFDASDVFRLSEREAGTLMLWTAPTEDLGVKQMYGAEDAEGGAKMAEAFERAKEGGAYASLMGEDARGDLVRAIAEPTHRAVVVLGQTSGSGARLHLVDGTWVKTSWLHRTCAQYRTRCVVVGWGAAAPQEQATWSGSQGAMDAAGVVAEARSRFDVGSTVREVVAEVTLAASGQEGVTAGSSSR